MKKIFVCAAVLALLASGCQNEEIVKNEALQKGELFTLEVGRGFESRTVLSGDATHWSEDDALYVSGKAGAVNGKLKFVEYVNGDKTRAVFSGFISGGQPSELQHIVFPVPEGGKIDMSAREAGKLDAPMIGTINGGAVATLKNVGGLLAFKVEGGNGNVYDVKATADGNKNMTGGSYTFDASTGKLTYDATGNGVASVEVKNNYAYVPVATTTEATDGAETTTQTVSVSVQVFEENGTEAIIETPSNVTITKGDIMGDGVGNAGQPEASTGLDMSVNDQGDVTAQVSTAAELSAAIARGDVKLTQNIELNSKVTIPGNVQRVTLDLNGKKLSGTIETNSILTILDNSTESNNDLNDDLTIVIGTKYAELNLKNVDGIRVDNTEGGTVNFGTNGEFIIYHRIQDGDFNDFINLKYQENKINTIVIEGEFIVNNLHLNIDGFDPSDYFDTTKKGSFGNMVRRIELAGNAILNVSANNNETAGLVTSIGFEDIFIHGDATIYSEYQTSNVYFHRNAVITLAKGAELVLDAVQVKRGNDPKDPETQEPIVSWPKIQCVENGTATLITKNGASIENFDIHQSVYTTVE